MHQGSKAPASGQRCTPHARLLFDLSAERAKVLPKGDVGVLFSCFEVVPQLRLASKCGAQVHPRRLGAFGVADRCRHVRDFRRAAERNEQATVVVAQDEIVLSDAVLAAYCGFRGIGMAWIKPLRAHRQCALAEDRQADGSQLGSVAMHPPDEYAGQACAACLECHEVPDAGFVLAASVVDDRDVARYGAFDGLE